MSVALPVLRTWIFVWLAIAGGARSLPAAEPLLLVGEIPREASFIGTASDGTLQFRVFGRTRRVTPTELVHWASLPVHSNRARLLLSEGSQLVLSDAWSGAPSWQVKGDSISVSSRSLGKFNLNRTQVRALVLQAPKNPLQRTRLLDNLLEQQHESDILRLTNGDQWQGRLVGTLQDPTTGQQTVQWLLDSTTKPLEVPRNRIAAICLGGIHKPQSQQAKWLVGLRDGNLLRAVSFRADLDQLQIRLANGLELVGSSTQEVTFLHSLTTACVYLSDLEAEDYQHVPYLNIPWSYQRDRSVLGGHLQVAGRSYSKGLGMHTASRLTYRLDGKEIGGQVQRFVAQVALDDTAVSSGAESGSATKRGSAIFRVYLKHTGAWQQAYVSPLLRGGDLPVDVKVELSDAKQIALVTDFADRGDERDYANWLDARLE